ncbi:MAG: bacteriohemerythrin [Thermoplasmatota archaeon]
MDNIQWDDSLKVGVDIIDEQHRMLIKRLEDLSRAVDEHREAAEVMRTVSFLLDYSKFHFQEEEKKMEESGYPHLEEHRKLHADFIGNIKVLEEDLMEEGATRAVGESVNTFLWNWLVNHIKVVDTRFGEFLNAD